MPFFVNFCKKTLFQNLLNGILKLQTIPIGKEVYR